MSLFAATATALLLFGAACDDQDDRGDINVPPTQAPYGLAAPDGVKRLEEVIVYDGRLDPGQLNNTAGAPAEVRVANRSDNACRFFIGDILFGLAVPAGENRQMSLTVPQGCSTETVTMGCAGNSARQGTAVIEFKGMPPGSGR